MTSEKEAGKVKVTIDGREIEAARGEMILPLALRMGIRIPNLCYHPAVTPYGACRLCLVEAERRGRKQITTSCTYPALEGAVIRTSTPEVLNSRKLVAELLLARSPNVKRVQEVAQEVGVTVTRFPKKDEKCILCGLCARVCGEVIGAHAISFVERGAKRKVETPFLIESETCVGCGACAHVCPTGCIKIEDIPKGKNLDFWHTTLKMAACARCGKPLMPQKELSHLLSLEKVQPELFRLCKECKKKEFREKVAAHSAGKSG